LIKCVFILIYVDMVNFYDNGKIIDSIEMNKISIYKLHNQNIPKHFK